ncbi:MAG: DUF11 domain-containing protein [Candidatus Marinimicrobia bacterium]|nr:DUF11 domain-containing protein [Candidatus Neomarinimicrobiota bacterium]
MKPTRLMLLLLILVGMSTMIYAAGTPAGTAITAYATGDYKDANSNALPRVTSNTVTTLVAQVAGVDISPTSTSKGMSANAFVTYSINVTNTGNGTDSFALVATTDGNEDGDFKLEMYHDMNVNGVIDPGEALMTSTMVLAADATCYSVLKITDITGGDGAPDKDEVKVTVTATSNFDGTVSDAGSSTTSITAATLDILVSGEPISPKPGEVMTYWMTVSNNGSETAYNVVITSPIPGPTTYIPGSIRLGSTAGDYAGATPLTDADDGDGSDYNITTSGAITFGLGDLASGASVVVFGKTVVNDGVLAGTNIPNVSYVNFENNIGVAYPEIMVGGGGGVATVGHLHILTLGADKSVIADPGDVVIYKLSVTNAGNTPCLVNLFYTSTFLEWTMYQDYDADGVIDAEDDLLIDTEGDGKVDVGTMATGQVIYVIAKAIVQTGTGDGDVDITNITGEVGAEPDDDGDDDDVSDSATITTTITAPILTLAKSVTPSGNQPPGAVLRYRIDAVNVGSGMATSVLMTDNIPTNTTYVAGSMKLNGVAKTDAADGDQGTLVGNSVVFNLPSIGPSGAIYLTFDVKVK